MKRRHQLATVQLDFQLPQRFNLKFIRDNKEETPVIIHRAILGSLERCIAILCESFGGKWPFWLSPRQVKVVPVGPAFDAYAKDLASQLYAAGLEAEADANQGKFQYPSGCLNSITSHVYQLLKYKKSIHSTNVSEMPKLNNGISFW